MDLETYKTTFNDGDSPGWVAIDRALAEIYGPGEPLAHFAGLPPMAGGQGPDGISVYIAEGHLHYVTYGFSELHYEEAAAGKEVSGYGFELTFRLKHAAPENRDGVPRWPVAVMQNLYNYVQKSGRSFLPNQAIPIIDRPLNADLQLQDCVITGLGFIQDPQLGRIETPHGAVEFVQMIGLTQDEAKAIKADSGEIERIFLHLKQSDMLCVTDMKRGI